MDNQKLTKLASIIIGFIIAILLIVMGFRFVQNTFIRAEDIIPADVVVTEVTQNSAKITWATGRETQSVVEYGSTPTALNFFAPETQNTLSHSVDLTLLSPNTTYYFQIRVGDKKFDNGGVPWSFTTKGSGTTQPPTNIPTQPVIPTATPSSATTSSCNEVDCQKIKEKIGKGCTARDYSLCIAKPTPTLIVAPKITITPEEGTATPTATSTP
jgi:hypothetical protein